MLEFIAKEFIKDGGLPEDTKKLLELVENIDFEPKKVITKKTENAFNGSIYTYTAITPNDINNQVYIHYYVNHSNIANQITATLQRKDNIKFSTKVHTTKDGKKTIKFFRGYIITPDKEIYLFTENNENTLSIKYYDNYQKHNFKTDNLFLHALYGLSFEKITMEPTSKTTIELDYTDNQIQTLNYLFRNPQIIINSIQNTTNKKR